ncbi:PilC/PilY family type IV pilus protein [Undibacterium sp.]|jgi:type IV pilus assembly protein PilY1|uniref:PilC/PilY family type IV pilus protein n=1 Tax=Undibacterium sp. TaxID=1914977 RepID=UPI002B91296A|nr:PilC/PilY family type IV pilus protein [Undibacterium sp.]HTD02241.1 PilC/PilY family type IV pilus protein [Undibacterium sp.]
MKKFSSIYISALWALPLIALAPPPVFAQLVVSDTLTGPTSSYGWTTTNGACLTAGDSTTTPTSSSIPACNGLPYYSGKTQVGGVSGVLPDPSGQGALRLTNGDTTTGSNGNNQTGSVISTTPFPTNQGVQVTFSTVTYGGNAYKNSAGQNSGADGIAFFLMDGTKTATPGAFGGSLGYSCSQGKTPADGVDGGYLAVAIDEFGNFSNPGDATSDGPGQKPGSIVIRGSGSISAKALQRDYPTYYPSTLSASNLLTAVQNTCKTGYLQNWSGGKITDANKTSISNQSSTTEKVADYNLIVQPSAVSTTIYNQEATAKPLRANANVFTYALSITQDGLLSLSYSVNNGSATPVIAKQSITANNGKLPPSFRFGFTSGTGGGSNVHEILCFKAAQINAASDSAGTNVQQSARVQAGSQVYLAYYHPVNSWGQLTASDLLADASGNVSINSTANWDASCVLTGGKCSSTGVATTAQGSGSRNILSWSGTAGVAFQYTSLTSAQQTALGGSTDGTTRTAFLRGDRSQEITAATPGPFRGRDGVLGDIMNSSPVWVGPPSSNFAGVGTDLLTSKSIAEYGAVYTKFMSDKLTRANIVYVGSNDGMLHGFRAGAYDASGSFVKATNDGQEVLAYVPANVVSNIHPSNAIFDFSSPQYSHNSYVDATPASGDLYYGGAWHTWLVGGTGAGGNATGAVNEPANIANSANSTATGVLYALDITDPTQFKEANAASVVLGEWDSSNISCGNASNCKTSLGSQYGTPIIRKMHDGNWAVIFGNGRDSATGTAGIFIMSVDYKTGARAFRFLDTGVANADYAKGLRNGIDYVASADLDGDHVTDYLYAGDALGHVWRFDVSDSDPSKWAAGSSPMFTTSSGQPISTRVTVNSVLQSGGSPRLLISFGTGQQWPQNPTSATKFASGTQALYGIWDWDLSAWNAKSGVKYASLTAPQSYSATNLQTQTMTTNSAASGAISGYRTVTANTVCWKGSKPSCTQFGWVLALDNSAGEQIIYNPVVAYGTFLVNTTIPSVNQVLSCTSQPASGYTMAISPETGGAPITSFFASAVKDAGFSATGIIAGFGLSATGTPSIVTSTSGKPYLVQQTVSGVGAVTKIDPPSGKAGRLTWVELR